MIKQSITLYKELETQGPVYKHPTIQPSKNLIEYIQKAETLGYIVGTLLKSKLSAGPTLEIMSIETNPTNIMTLNNEPAFIRCKATDYPEYEVKHQAVFGYSISELQNGYTVLNTSTKDKIYALPSPT